MGFINQRTSLGGTTLYFDDQLFLISLTIGLWIFFELQLDEVPSSTDLTEKNMAYGGEIPMKHRKNMDK